MKGNTRIGVPKFLLLWKPPCHQMLIFPLPIQSPQNQHYILFFLLDPFTDHLKAQDTFIFSPTWKTHPICSPSSPDLFHIFPKPEEKARFWASLNGRQNLLPPPQPRRGTKFISVHVLVVDMRVWEPKVLVKSGLVLMVGRKINSRRAAGIICEKLVCKWESNAPWTLKP